MTNTTELKKLAEAASLTGAQLVNMSVFEFAEAQRLKQQFRQIRPEAILKLLAINAELVVALKDFGVHTRDCGVNNYRFNSPCTCGLDSALAKTEGGEL